MRLLFVNHAHPETKHISGVRLWRFAQELAKQGHHVIHATSTLADEPGMGTEEAKRLLSGHDWKLPLHISVKPATSRLLHWIRNNQLPWPIRKMGTAYAFLARGGVYYDWSDAAEKALFPVLHAFSPQAIYATFGNSSSIFLAKRLAQSTHASLILDFKDSISSFIPRLARPQVVRRCRMAGACTANAQALADEMEKYLKHQCEVIYSGVDRAFYDPAPPPRGKLSGPNEVVFTLTGSVYSQPRLASLLESLSAWRQDYINKTAKAVFLHYIGGMHALVSSEAARLGARDWIRSTPYLPVADLARQCRLPGVRANIYIRADIQRGPFHHKLLELLATGLPVVAYGGESEESISLAASCGSNLFLTPMDGHGLKEALTRIMCLNEAKIIPKSQFGWDVQAKKLEAVIGRVTGKN